MNRSMKWLLVIPFTVGVVTGMRRPASLVAEPACQVASRWVKAHPDSLAKTLAEISAYPNAMRKAMWTALPDSVRIALRHEQHKYYLTSRQWTEEQRAFLVDVDSRLDELTAQGAKAERAALEKRASLLFTPEVAGEVFITIGVDTPEQRAAQEIRVHGPNVVGLGIGTPVGDCTCDSYSGSGECGYGAPGICIRSAGCNTQIWGCGFLGYDRCDGQCVY